MELILYKEDIKNVGHTKYNNEGFVTFVLDETNGSCWIEVIFLRNLLKLFGEEYKILGSEEVISDNKITGKEDYDKHIYTNLPWDVFEKLEYKL